MSLQFKNDNPADCIEIGSIGPCSQGQCGMTGTALPNGDGVEIVYTYTYGCKNTFTLTMTEGSATAPGQVTSNECSYTAKWAGLHHGIFSISRMDLTFLLAAILVATCAMCFVGVAKWSKKPTITGSICGIPLDNHDATLIKQLVGLVLIKCLWGVAAAIDSGLTIIPTLGSDAAQSTPDAMIAGVAFVCALCVPTCGYWGAKERHRCTLAIFIVCNALSAACSSLILAMTVFSLLEHSSAEGGVQVAVIQCTLLAISSVISVASAIVGYRVLDHPSMRGALGANLVHHAPYAVSSVTPIQPIASIQTREAHPSNVCRWSVDEVARWLADELQLRELSVVATREQLDGAMLTEMTVDAWCEIGATAMQAARIVVAFKRKNGLDAYYSATTLPTHVTTVTHS